MRTKEIPELIILKRISLIERCADKEFDEDEINLIKRYCNLNGSITDKRGKRDVARFYGKDKALRVKYDGSLEECSRKKIDALERRCKQNRNKRFEKRKKIGETPLRSLRVEFEEAIKKDDADTVRIVRKKLKTKFECLTSDYWVMFEHPLPGDDPSRVSFEMDLAKMYVGGLTNYLNSGGNFKPRFLQVLSDLLQ